MQCVPLNGKGVGDDEYSYGYDGSRRVLYAGSSMREHIYRDWEDGDVIGVSIEIVPDKKQGSLNWYNNGEWIQEASLDDIFRGGLVNLPLYPALSIQYTHTLVSFNFGQKAFAHKPPTGFLPLVSGILGNERVLRLWNIYKRMPRDDDSTEYGEWAQAFSPLQPYLR
eukprot:TRINITY_DN4015_c0_g1_i1.p1 TRINITY_DN4015_c0_g1~~TRINITY_DN4015_c0_g1_i1.p1  ORF type:complete len:167 (-),score=36.95 TRINITY_DN4015_c0_g1_i1:183-683(-)